MANAILLPQTGTVTIGSSFNIGIAATEANLQFTPQQNSGFSGTVVIESSTSPQPGANDWFAIATLVFSAHTTTVDINLFLSNNPWMRARTTVAAFGAISIYMAAS